ncbi:MAG: hypothetical protein SF162_12615 [bacterium]|nr:hypothetical protein [bacterium]
MRHDPRNGIPPPPPDDDVRAFLGRWSAPPVDPAARTRLLDALADGPLAVLRTAPRPLPLAFRLRQATLIVRAQRRIVGGVTWLASLLVMAFGVWVTFLFSQFDTTVIPLAIIAPVVTAVGVAFLYGEEVDPALELQRAAPVSPRLVLLARLALLFGFDLVLALTGSAILAASTTGLSLAPLIEAWLVPMTFLSALAFWLSVLFFDPLLSMLISMLAWVVIVVRHHFTHPVILPLPDMLTPHTLPVLLIAAAGLVIAGLWLSEHDDRFMRIGHG